MRRLVLLLAALDAAAAARCDGPYKTLSSDCRGLSTDPNVVCVLLDQRDRATQPSPCATRQSPVKNECAAATGDTCDILTYRIDYQASTARFRVTFPTSSAAGRRRLVAADNGSSTPAPDPTALRVDVTTPPPATSPAATRVDTNRITPTPPTTPATTLQHDVLVDSNPTTTPPPPPRSTSPAATRVDRTPSTTTPGPPNSLIVDHNPTTTPPPPPPPNHLVVDHNPTTTPPPVQPPGSLVDVTPSPPPQTFPPGNHVDFNPSSPPPTTTPSATRVDSPTGPTTSSTPSTTPPAVGTLVDASKTAGPSTAPAPTDALDQSVETNDFVEAIGQLKLDPSVIELRIVGGSSEFGTRGKTIQLSIDMQVLAQSPHVTSVWFANCNISSQFWAGGVLSGMPTGLTDLVLRNTLMRSEPADLSALPNLKSLQLQQNYLETLTSRVYLPMLTMLDVSENSLTSFEAGFPVLESLYLNKNSFNAIPSTVYSMSKLQELQFAENPIVAIVVSVTQYEFLKKIRLKIDKPPISPLKPVVYVAKTTGTSVRVMSTSVESSTPTEASEVVGLDLNSSTVDLTNAVAQPIGLLVDLQGFPVWKVTDAEYEIFRTQQEVIASKDIVIGGTKVQTYLAMAAAAAAAATSAPPPTNGPNPDREKTTAPSDASHGSGKSHKTLTISLVVVVAVVALVAAIVLVFRKRQRGKKSDDSTDTTLTTPTDQRGTTSYQTSTKSKSTSHNSIESFGALGATMHDANVRDLFSSRRVRVTDIEDVRPIGAGATGIVWLVKFRGSRFLASKRLIQSPAISQRMTEFVNEIVIAADLDHPRIVGLVGIAWTNETDLQALYEYMPNGDLQTHLHSIPAASLSWYGSKITMAIDIVEALVYTHSFNPPLLHRDLRTRNVLLDADMNPKLSNFGSARFASEQNTMTTDGIGSGRWLAPEILKGNTDYNAASDMYAFGVLLCELDTHAAPYEDVRDSNGKILVETHILELVTRGAVRPTFSPSCPSQIRDIATSCLSHNPQDRPTAIRVAYQMRLLVREWS